MFGFRKSPNTKVVKQNSIEPAFLGSSNSSPFDSDSDSDAKKTFTPARRTSSELILPNLNSNAFSDDEGSGASTICYALRNKYNNDFRDSGGLENQSVHELEGYATYKAEETTKSGEQITRTHEAATNIGQDLSRGEKLLGSLGGMFSKTWKPKKTKAIKWSVITRDDSFKRRGNHLEQREKLGLASVPKGRSNLRKTASEPTTALQKVEVEKTKQDDGLNDLSDILGELKVMAIDMGYEIERCVLDSIVHSCGNRAIKTFPSLPTFRSSTNAFSMKRTTDSSIDMNRKQ
ncbi:hypothetical protein IFM89_037472, partial [Coptis chinensis]